MGSNMNTASGLQLLMIEGQKRVLEMKRHYEQQLWPIEAHAYWVFTLWMSTLDAQRRLTYDPPGAKPA